MLKTIIFGILSIIGSTILILGSLALLLVIQAKLFLPQKYIMWIFKYPTSNLVFIYTIFGFYYIANKIFNIKNKDLKMNNNSKRSFIKNHKKTFLSAFVVINII